MKTTVNGKNFMESKLYKRISKEIAEYSIKELEECGYYLSFSEMHRRLNLMRKQNQKVYTETEDHIYSKNEVKQLAEKEAKRRLNTYRSYFNSCADNNIGSEIGRYYSAIIIRRLELWKRAIRLWYKFHKIPLPVNNLTLHGIDDAELVLNFNSKRYPKHNLKKIIVEYINDNILNNCTYGESFDELDIDINLEAYLPLGNIDLSPFEEKLRKLTGCYEAWIYSIDDEHLRKRVNNEAEICERQFFKSGYIQDLVNSIFSDFLEKVNETLKDNNADIVLKGELL